MSSTEDTVDRTSYTTPVPSAQKDPTRIYSEKLADSMVVLDAESMHYHSLNQTAAQVWDLCDGQRSVDDITVELRIRGIDAPEEAVALAVAELGEAELLEATSAVGESRVHRRRVLKMAAAGLIGAGVLPVVQSITVPHAASAQTVSGSCCGNCLLVGCITVNLSLISVTCTGFVDVCLDLFGGDALAAVEACIGVSC